MSDIHILVIKHDSHPLDHEPPDVDYSIECPGVTDACRMWVGCDVPKCVFEEGHNEGEIIHGQEHRYVASTWSVPTDTCYLIVADEMCDAADFLAGKESLGPGRYEIGCDFDEGAIADFQLIRAVAG